MDESLSRRLVAMAEEDLRVRAELAATGELYAGYAPRMAEVHRRHAEALKEIVAAVGWPGRSLVGAEGMRAAWLILQHAIGDPALQRACVPLLRDAVARGEAEPAHLAYLEDRICFFERRPQRYGTQFDWDEEGQLSPWTLEDPERVDAYRREVGLEPLAQKVAEIRAAGEPPPADVRRRREEMLAWARSVGWLPAR